MQSNSAVEPVLLWLDLTRDRSTPALMSQFGGRCECRLAEGRAGVAKEQLRQIDMICVHFDRPDANGLNLLLETKRTYPSIPITMFTVQHSEELAIWAMRARVWEFVVLPLAVEEQNRYLESLQQLCEVRRAVTSLGRKPVLERNPPLPGSIRLTTSHQKHKALSKVMPYIEQHFRESVDQKKLAQQCGMTPFRFSRLFKEVNGVGFMEYILGKRMDFAKHLLENSQMPVTSIGYEAGFKDPSYFARAFKQLAGCSPSDYRQSVRTATTIDASVSEADQTALGIGA
ncbi:helix-turn-helix domain-containing protein [Metapseudomonas resinovorans]|uniref:helix-turn-helix domain-containing protein n=1 Tax=Metapseudomonas resinovorans TaxID=53412 RepID=UPI0004913DB3|nr:response regulator transcription factor [Pseudomonas resinovorans]MDE3739687.1 response regulator transcription factor [Pseudomonas resinovorans]